LIYSLEIILIKMRNFTLSCSLLSIILGVLFWLAAPLSFAQTKQQVYDSINARRVRAGLSTISVCKRLERSAQSWVFFMRYSLKHNVKFLKRFHRTGAECLALGDDPVQSWMKSKPHRQSIMGRNVKEMGLGYWRGKWVFRTFSN
jgi:uncharacterized protein YkwD